MKRLYYLIAVALLLLGVASSAGVWDIPSGTANAGVIIAPIPEQGGGCSGSYGYDDPNSSDADNITQDVLLTKITIDCAGSVSSVNVYGRNFTSDTDNVKALIYDDDGGGGEPGTLLCTTEDYYDATWSSSSWRSISISGTCDLSAGDYWVGATNDNNGYLIRTTTSTGRQRRKQINTTYATPPDPFVGGYSYDNTTGYAIELEF